MSKKGPKPAADVVAGARSPVDLARELADRERQLRDLTEQALGFLEELAESRRLNGDRDQLAGRIGELERALADARHRLRHAGGCVDAATPLPDGTRAALAVVFCGSDTFPDAGAASALGGEVPVFWAGPPSSVGPGNKVTVNVRRRPGRPEPPQGKVGPLQVIAHRDAHTPAQCWNLAMAATTAEYVLLLGPGARLPQMPVLPELVPPNAAVLCPRIERNHEFDIGCEEIDELLRFRPHAVTGDSDVMTAVPWPSGQAFVVRRAAFERIGLFDEGLVGSAALLDYTLRARQQSFDIFGAPGLAVAADAWSSPMESMDDERMRLLVLASYRPDKLGKALAETPLLWTLGAEAPGFLAQLLARLPAGDGLAAQRAVLDQICVGLIAKAMPATDVARRAAVERLALLRAFAAADLPHGKDELAAALRDAEEPHRVEPAAAFEALARDIALCARLAAAAATTAQQTRAEVRALDVERHAHMARAEQSEGARSAIQAQLDQVRTWLEDAQKELRQTQEARHQAAQQFDHAHTELALSQQQLEQARTEQARSEPQLEQARTELARFEQQLDQARTEQARSEQQLEQARTEQENSRQELEQVHTELARSRQQVEQMRAELARSRQQLQAVSQSQDAKEREFRELHSQIAQMARIAGLPDAAVPGTLHVRLTQLHEDSRRLAATLQAAGAVDAAALLATLDSLGQRLDTAETTIGERERWIAALLDEVGKRRLFPRGLFDHERALLERVRRAP